MTVSRKQNEQNAIREEGEGGYVWKDITRGGEGGYVRKDIYCSGHSHTVELGVTGRQRFRFETSSESFSADCRVSKVAERVS